MGYRPSGGGYRPSGYRPSGGYRPRNARVSSTPAKKKDDGWLATIAKAVVQGGEDIGNVAYNAPAGLADYAGETYHALGRTVHEPFGPTGLSGILAHPTDIFALSDEGKRSKKQLLEDITHPLRHPGYTLLDLLPFASGGSGAVLRGVGTAGREGALATAARAATQGGKRRIEIAGDVSREPLVAERQFGRGNIRKAAQVARDVHTGKRAKVSERAAVKQRKRAEKWLEEADRTAAIAEEAPAIRFQAAARGLGRGNEGDARRYALRLIAEQVSPDERVAVLKGYESQAKKAGNRLEARRHQAKIELARRAADYVEDGPDGRPVFKTGTKTGTRLERTYQLLTEVSNSRDEALHHLGLMDEANLAGAKVKAARFARGASYVAPTASKLGRYTPVELATIRRAHRLEKRYDALYAKHPGWFTTTTRARTAEEAADRLHALETEHTKAVDEIAAARFGPIDKAEVARRNNRNRLARKGAMHGGIRLKVQATVKDERRRQVERDIEAAILRNPDHPTIQRWQERSAEIDSLREALNPDIESVFGEGPTAPLDPSRFGTVQEHRYQARSPALERLGERASQAKEDAARARAAALARQRNTGMIGPEAPAGFDPTAPYIGNPTAQTKFLGRPRVVTTAGKKGRPGSMKVATGAAVRHSLQREDLADFVAARHRETLGARRLLRRLAEVEKAGTKSPQHATDIWVWRTLDPKTGKPTMFVRSRIPGDVASFLRDPERFSGTEAERASMLDQLKAALTEKHDWSLDPDAKAVFEQRAKEGQGVFVPKELLGEYANPTPWTNFGHTSVGKFIDTLENAQKFALIYFKVNYPIIQGLSNVAINLIDQGFAAPNNLRRAAVLSRSLGDDLTGLLDAYAGQGFAAQIGMEGQNIISRGSRKYAAFASALADRIPRRAAFLYHAGEAGFRTPEQLRALLTEDRYATELHDISLKSNEAMVNFDDLTPTERSVVRRIVFIYPWVKGSTKWAGRFLGDHPVQAAVFGQLGQRGTQIQQETFGPEGVPSYLYGSFDVGGRLVNPASFNPFGTAADLGLTAAAVASGKWNAPTPAERLAPWLGAFIQLANRRTSSGYPIRGQLPSQLRQVLSDPTALAAAARQLGAPAAIAGPNRPSASFPAGTQGAWRFLLGGFYPRPYDVASINRAAALQRTGK